MRRRLVTQQVDEHRREAVDTLGVLPGLRDQVGFLQRVERAIGHGVAVDEQQGLDRVCGGRLRHTASLGWGTDIPARPPRDQQGDRVTIFPESLPGIRHDLADQWLPTRMGIEVTEWDPKRVVGTMPVAGNLQPYGLLHGGANATLAESLGSIATALNAPPGRVALGLELSCTHHRAARSGHVAGVATPIHTGRFTSTFQVVITVEVGKRTCTARLTCVLRDAAPGA